MVKKIILILMLAIPMSLAYGADSNGDNFLGYWMMKDGNFILKMEKDNNNIYRGHVVWLKNPNFPKGDKNEGKVQSDRNNPDPALKGRDVLGLEIVADLKLDGKKLKDGWVYDSWNGKMYHGSAKIKDENELKLKGSLDKFGILGYTMKAYRVPKEEYSKYGIIE